jgi:hypothetical protein
MSRDIQVISVVDDLQVLEVTEIENAVPRTIRILGKKGFNSAQRVEINDFGVDSFTIVSDKVLLAAPGSVFDTTPVSQMKISVLAGELTSALRARLVFGPTRRTKVVEGIQKLIQQVVRVILTRVGSNRFNPGDGGGLLQVIGSSLAADSRGKIAAGVARAISLTKEQITSAQASVSMPSNEKLLNLELVGIDYNEADLEVTARVSLTTFAGQSITIPLVL